MDNQTEKKKTGPVLVVVSVTVETLTYDPESLSGVSMSLKAYQMPKHCSAFYNTLRQGFTALGGIRKYVNTI